MGSFTESAIRLLLELHSLDRIPRSGFLLRGVVEPENVAAHSHALALLACLAAPRCDPPVDVLTAVRMALIHDLAESKTMDVPLTVTDPAFRSAKTEVESVVIGGLFSGQDPQWRELFADYQTGKSPEARLVKGLDKVQMMIKVIGYEREGRGRLEDFWANAENFRDHDVPEVRELFDGIFRLAGRRSPVEPDGG
jgi:putative hydrolase of HD superfamily